MTIHHFTDNTDLSVYFHMRSHYRRLKNVKSRIDNSAPLGFMKTASTPPSSERSWKTCSYEENYLKNSQIVPSHGSIVKKHSCITSAGTKSDTCVRSTSLPPRPKTRRHPYEMPFRHQCKARSQSVGPTSRKDVAVGACYARIKKKRKALKHKEKVQENETVEEETKKEGIPSEIPAENDETCRSSSSRKMASDNCEKFVAKPRTEEHEYLQFLLRITEDIIINNLYTTEDIEKVFQNHIEANRDRLKMGKMQAQLDKLCRELNIPYKDTENHIKNEDCYSYFFENAPHNLNYNHNLNNCECTSKRTLELEIKRCEMRDNIIEEKVQRLESNFQVENDNIQNNLDILMSRHSLGRVTECTEPTNSTGTLTSSTKHSSLTTVVSFENVNILPCFENLNVGDQNEVNRSKEDRRCEENVQPKIFSKDPPLTEKEKLGCIEEEILFEKCSSDVNYPAKNNVLINESKPENTDNISINEEILWKDNETDLGNKSLSEFSNIVKEEQNLHNDKLHCKPNDTSLACFINTQESLKEAITKVDADMGKFNKKNTDITPLIETKQVVEDNALPKFTFDKFTQITVSQCDKECNTNTKLNDYSINDDYILINGPVYILKTVLQSQDKFVLHNSNSISAQAAEDILPEKLLNNTAIPFNCFESLPPPQCTTAFGSNSVHFCKLLNSDYDLTPQRDENSFENYHNLLVDASTSVTNLNVNTVGTANLNLDNLLLTEKYSLNCIKEVKENVQNQTDDKLANNSCLLLNNELSMDGQYEIKSYTLPKEVNGSVKLSGYSINDGSESDIQERNEMAGSDVSLTAYEIKSEAHELDKLDINPGEVSELEEIIKVHMGGVDNCSQISSIRSEKEQSSTSSLTNTKHILGKRKLQHPL